MLHHVISTPNFLRSPLRPLLCLQGATLCLTLALLSSPTWAQTPATADNKSGEATNTVPHQLTLAQAETLLLERNLAVTAAKYQIEAGRAARLIAAFKPNPVLTIGAEQIGLNRNLPRTLYSTNANQAAAATYTIRLDKLIERGGKRELRLAQAEEQLKANEAQMLDAVRTQLLQLRQAFTQAALARANVQLAEETQQQYENTIRLTEAKVENGDLPGVEVYRARVGLLQYEQAVLQARTSYEQAARDVLNLLGATPTEVLPGKTQTAQTEAPVKLIPASFTGTTTGSTADSLQLPAALPVSLQTAPLELQAALDDRPVPQSLAELRTLALSARPDVQSAQHTLMALQQGVALAQAQRIRDIQVGTAFQRVGSDQTVGGTVSIPLFIYNNQRAAIAQAEAQRKAAETLLKQTELQATTEVEKAYQAYVTARRTLDLFGQKNLTQVAKLRSIAQISFKEGASSLFEFLDAQRTYNAAQVSYNQARADYQNALWQLEAAIGQPLR